MTSASKPASLRPMGDVTLREVYDDTLEPVGKKWRAAERLTAKDNTVLAAIGQTCERVPASSLPWLIEQDLVRPLDCTCASGVPRVPAPNCPVDHAALLAPYLGATVELDQKAED